MNYDEYLATQFREIDLSVESEILGQDAKALAHEIGGKGLGLLLLGKLIEEWNHDKIRSLDYRIVSKKQASGLIVPQAGNYMFRSNASFEYGCPPGILESIHRLEPGRQIPDEQIRAVIYEFEHIKETYVNNSKLLFILQQELMPRASGVLHSSFDLNPDDPAIIEASIGPCVSATLGLPNLIHYRAFENTHELYKNFPQEEPFILFWNGKCYYDYSEFGKTETMAFEKIAGCLNDISDAKSIWENYTTTIHGQRSPLETDEINELYSFAKYVEKRLKKPVKLEFSIGFDGTIYMLQLDPSFLEVGNIELGLQDAAATPFTNMPVSLYNAEVVVEGTMLFGEQPKGDYVLVTCDRTWENIEKLARKGCKAIISRFGSRVNHSFNGVRTYMPLIGFTDLDLTGLHIGYQPDLRVDVRSDGRFAQMRLYK